MKRTTNRKTALTTLLFSLACGALLAQQIAPVEASEALVPYHDLASPAAPDIIFSNLDRPPERYNSDPFDGFSIVGKRVLGDTERWYAVAFTPRVDAQAKVLLAAIGYDSGTKRINLGIYSNNEVTDSVGDLLPGGQGSTTQMPDAGDCCQLAKVTLRGEGVTLSAGTRYWLVVSPNNANAADFEGTWHVSNRATYAYLQPPFPWNPQASEWPAALIRGTRVNTNGSANTTNPKFAIPEGSAPTANIIIFTNLDRTSTKLYAAGAGIPIYGKDLPPEDSVALPFTPRADVHAKTLAAAIGYVSGTKLVKLGIYSDNKGMPGASLPDGEGSTTEMPDLGDCCRLAKIDLPGTGIALTKGTQYWLVASPDDINAPTFHGAWQTSSLAVGAYQEPEHFINWTSFDGVWLAAEIRGTNP